MAVEVTQSIVLVRSWRVASLSGSWTDAVFWWTPAVEAVADALADSLLDARPACEMLGRQRAAAGIYLDEARADVEVAARLAGLRDLEVSALVDALTVGWVDRMLDTYFTSACVDPLTGLASLPYLLTRLSEVYADARVRGVDAAHEYALVVVRTAGGGDAVVSGLELTAVQAALRAAFAGGETLAGVDAGCAVALVRRRELWLGESLARLHRELRTAQREHRVTRPRLWLERLPGNPDDLPNLLRQLSH